MQCYLCKKEITSAIRKYIPARNAREKSNFRELCTTCYNDLLTLEGYEESGRTSSGLPIFKKQN